MKLSSALLVTLLVFASNATLGIAAPNPAPAGAEEGIKAKLAQLGANVGSRETSRELEARAAVTGRVNADGVRYRTCAKTSCTAIGQYPIGHIITIKCRTQGESVNGWNWWDLMTNGYYISDSYVDWTGGIPDVC